MGCSSSSASYEQSTHVSRRRLPVLTERDAWDIAMAWCDQLRGCVRLELDSEKIPSSIIPVFEWVTFVFHGDLKSGCQDVSDRPKAAAYARAATIAWFALSCCEGYSGVENPGFWKRVFYELLYPKDLPSATERMYKLLWFRQHPITDAIRFFDDPDRPFPRIKLAHKTHENDAIIASVLLGQVSLKDRERDAKLERILAKLQPHMRKYDATRSVPVELDFFSLPSAKHAELLRNVPSKAELESGARAAMSVASMMAFPPLYLRSVNITDKYTLDVHKLYSLMPPSDVEVLLSASLSSFVQGHQLWRGLLDQLQTDSAARRWRVTPVHMMQKTELSTLRFSVLCSALPHLKTVHFLKLPHSRYVKKTSVFIVCEWAWLGYAIFHPDAASTSGLKSLEVDLDSVSSGDIAAFTRMAVGNNLLGGGSIGYLEALISSGTDVKSSPDTDDTSSLFTFTTESWVSMCTQVAAEAVDDPERVRVVVPGLGSGWVRRYNIIKTRTRRAGVSCVRTLRVTNYTEAPIEDATKETLLGLLQVLGSRLTSLHFENSNHTSASSVHAILRLCPSLKSLRIHHDGSFWADEALAMEVPRLEELELTVHTLYVPVQPSDAYLEEVANYKRNGGPRPREPWATGRIRTLQKLKALCLPHLKALHVISTQDGAYEEQEPVLISFLSEQSVLQYLHWSRGGDTSRIWADIQGQRVEEDTLDFLGVLPAEHHLSGRPLHLACRLAFLSVVDMAAQSSSVSQLGKDVVMLIFRYATRPSRREIAINQLA